MNNRKVVLSLFDESGNMVRPWAEAGYNCICVDIQNAGKPMQVFEGGGSITFIDAFINKSVVDAFTNMKNVAMIFGFPPCTDLAVSGAPHFAKKREKNPNFQQEATDLARLVERLGKKLGVPWMVENPVSVLSSLWRKPDYAFDPYEYGGYLPEADVHPRWPDYIAPRDAYSKRTCLWTGGGFKMPERKEVACESYGKSRQHTRLGGKSAKTKQIRSETPRGFAIAVYEANNGTA